MQRKFSIISLGPGDPELITIQALKALRDNEIIYVQSRTSSNHPDFIWKGSVAYNILMKIQKAHEDWFKNSAETFEFIKRWDSKLIPVYTPMNYNHDAWLSQVEMIAEAFNHFNSIAYVTLGDAGVYSSAYYLLDIIKSTYPEIYNNTEVIPGISSFSHASAKALKPLCLGNTGLEIKSMHVKKPNSSKIYMRFHKGDNTTDLKGDDLYCFENLGLDNEIVSKGKPETISNYLTVIVDFADQKEDY